MFHFSWWERILNYTIFFFFNNSFKEKNSSDDAANSFVTQMPKHRVL